MTVQTRDGNGHAGGRGFGRAALRWFGGVPATRNGVVGLLIAAGAAAPAAGQSGFRITDEETDLDLRVTGMIQFRYQATIRPDAVSDDEVEGGFDFRRARLGVKGTAVEERVPFELSFEAGTGDVELLDAWVGFKPFQGTTFKAGQFKLEFDRERSMSITKPQSVDRATLSYQINPVSGIRVQGVEAEVETSWFRVAAQLHDGSDSYNSGFGEDNAIIAANVRGEWSVLSGPGSGEKAEDGEQESTIQQFRDFSAPRGTPLGIMIGGGLYGEKREEDGPQEGASRFAYTADVNFEWNGFNAAVIGIGQVAEDLNTGASPLPEHVNGLIVQGGYFVTDTVEGFARHEYAWTSDEEFANFAAATVGVNWFIIGNALKLTSDFTYSYEGVSPFFERTPDAVLGTGDGEDSYVIRTQLQMLF